MKTNFVRLAMFIGIAVMFLGTAMTAPMAYAEPQIASTSPSTSPTQPLAPMPAWMARPLSQNESVVKPQFSVKPSTPPSHDLASAPTALSNNLLQFTAGGHILGFQNDGVYIVSTRHALRIQFVDANTVAPQSSAPGSTTGKTNPLDKVTWRNLWDGISVTYQATASGIAESVYTIETGASVEQIHLRYNAPAQINVDGSMTLGYSNGQMTESAPSAWQEINGQRVPVQVAFQVRDSSSSSEEPQAEIGFIVGVHDSAHPLTIDPTLTWNQFFGTDGEDRVQSVALDGSGNVYVTGTSDGTWGNPKLAYTDLGDAFVAELNGASGSLVWNTFLGGASGDFGDGIALYGNTYIYVVGYSDATWGTPLNAFMGTGTAPQDAFVARLDLSGNLQWNTFLGGTGRDSASAVAVDTSGYVYVAGSSDTSWGTPKRAFSIGDDGFVAKLNSIGVLQWNTFLGGSSWDYAEAVAVDASGNVYVAGESNSSWGSPVRPYAAATDVFAAKLDTSGNLVWNTFLGGTSADNGGSIAVDGSGNVYVVAYSWGTWGSPQQGYTGGIDGFVAKLNATNGVLTWNTFVGGSGADAIFGVAVDGGGNIFVTGDSDATWGTPVSPFVGGIGFGGDDAFAAKLNATNGALIWNTFLGGTDDDFGRAIVFDGSSKIFVAGYSGFSWGTPVHAYSGGEDAMIAKLNSSNGVLQWNTFQGTAGDDSGVAIALDATGNVYITGYTTGDFLLIGDTIPNPRKWSGGQDAFVVKMDPTGAWQWYTFLGGTGNDSGNAIAADTTGHVYVAGNSNVGWGAPTRAFGTGYDGYIARLNASTGALQWNTFIGGSGTDFVTGIAVDSSGNTYVSGESTASWGSPVRSFGGGGWDAFAAKVDPTGALVWNTFLGGTGSDEGNAITLQYTLLYVTGDSTASWGSPKRGYTGGVDAFVAQVNAVTGDLMWNTFLGGPGNEYGKAITFDSIGNLYVAGSSDANWGPTPMRAYSAGTDTFVSKLNTLGVLQWNTFLGGSGTDDGRGIAVDNKGHIYVIGYSDANWGAPVMPYTAGADVYVAALNSNGGLWWNTFLGGARTDYGNGIAANGNSQLYITGSSNYPWGSYEDITGGFDAFVAQIDGRGQLFLPLIMR